MKKLLMALLLGLGIWNIWGVAKADSCVAWTKLGTECGPYGVGTPIVTVAGDPLGSNYYCYPGWPGGINREVTLNNFNWPCAGASETQVFYFFGTSWNPIGTDLPYTTCQLNVQNNLVILGPYTTINGSSYHIPFNLTLDLSVLGTLYFQAVGVSPADCLGTAPNQYTVSQTVFLQFS